jgi:hypothetical protein
MSTINDVASSADSNVQISVEQQQQQPPSAGSPPGESSVPENDEQQEKIPQLPHPVCTPAQVANTLGTKEMENLFIDMSFYARLGFLQAPSCLKCAYRDAHAGTDYRESIAAKGCGGLLLWRKDTALPIHPDNMQSNSVVITCQTAKAFMRGESVAGVHWDKDSQKLVSN